MLKDTNIGQTHYVGDGCNPPRPPQQYTAENIIQLFQNYADKNEDENVRVAVKFIREEIIK